MNPIGLPLRLNDKNDVHNHYLPMIKGGGLFVPTSHRLDFNMSVLVDVELVSEKQRAKVPGRVVWLTPEGAQRGLPRGVGIQFTSEHQGRIQQFFEGLIGDALLQPPPRPPY
ncbi:MAG: PilZ domain-containing protein [Thiothrix sp.]|nr:PilZ domain-containing protein [Thiothrix sp.]HPQ95112.1 PilZ domain-containing protein [Thiolinea sp.]